ncbi:MAG: sensor domain-containing diguanylate cyclase [Candidatus Omnitrophica bacterium]|nr:sensor domain-containing diguanylate cyclase [Candidatus Omnitrophota bacterium]MBU1933536.1 sensor domain-containing diguanylate cyclase [Candidatus Omnitrophota bacterium]
MELKNKSHVKIGTLCSISFLVISYLIFRTEFPKTPTILLYNLVIIFSLQGLGFNRGALSLGAAVFLTTLLAVSTNFHYAWNTVVFFIVFLIVNSRIKNRDYYTRIIQARIGEVRENTNVLSDEYEKHRKETLLLERKEQRYRLLKDATSTLNSTLSIEKVAEYILDSALQIIGKTESALVYLVDTKKQELSLVLSRVSRDFDRVKAKKGDLLDETVFKERRCLLVEDIKKDFRFGEHKMKAQERSFRSVISCPLMEESKVSGIVRLEHSSPNDYTSEDLRLLDILCDLGAVSLENARLYKQTLDLAITDGLTGLYLRRYFIERLSKEIQHSLRNDFEFSFLMIDIDNFKNYNDKYGHTAGDIVLKTISAVLNRYVNSGVACRYGGEEFSLFLPQTSRKAAIKTAEDLKKAVKKEIVELRRVKTSVTVSIGVSSFPDDTRVQDELIMKADERLYMAKRQGKDKVVG